MRYIIFLLLFFLVSKPVLTQVRDKQEVQNKMGSAVNVLRQKIAELEKQIDEARKNGESEDALREKKDALKTMKETLSSINGETKKLSTKDLAPNWQTAGEGDLVVPKRDATRINSLPKKNLTDAELVSFIKNVNAGVERLIPAVERTDALNIYNETKTKYKTIAIVANAGTGCWMLGHWEKALVIMGKACMEEIDNADNLNNYAAFLIMTGGEHAAIPILNYLNVKYPNNSTILNNLGQAWFGLGEMNTAKKFLDSAISIYPNHSQANYTSASIVLMTSDSLKGFDASQFSHPRNDSLRSFNNSTSAFPSQLSDSLKSFNSAAATEGTTMKAINFLKASLKGNYDPEKQSALEKLGYHVRYSDLPPFNYPMKSDPLGTMQLIELMPRKLQTNVDDLEPAFAGQSFIKGVEEFREEIDSENLVLEKQLHDRADKLVNDIPYSKEFLEGHNCPAYLLAANSLILLRAEATQPGSPLITQLWLPGPSVFNADEEIPIEPERLVKECTELWNKEVVLPIIDLTHAWEKDMKNANGDCQTMNRLTNAFLTQRGDIYNRGVDTINNAYVHKSKRLQAWITLNLYGIADDLPVNDLGYTYALIGRLPGYVAKTYYKNEHYATICDLMGLGNRYYEHKYSNCKNSVPERAVHSQNIKQYKVDRLNCEYVKKFITPLTYEFEFVCNTIKEKSPLKKRNPNTKKGAVELSSRSRGGGGPLQARGPGIFFNPEIDKQSFAPLCLEDKTPSQCTLEYNRSGNLVGFNFQLNEDGTTLKDPDSVESGVDSRWSWNAIGSRTKSYMYRLLMK